jgi:hypothetical protein
MKQLMVTFPLSYHVPAGWFSHWLNMDHTAVTGTTVVIGSYITVSMDQIVAKALEHDNWDRLVVYEHDMFPPLYALNRMAYYSPEHNIVGSMYFEHKPPHSAFVYVEQPGMHYDQITSETVKKWCENPALYECGGVGFGFTSIARHVLEDWDKDVPMFNLDKYFGSHDLWFCHYARQQGYRVYVDSAIVCEHLSQIQIGLSDNQAGQLPDDVEIREFVYEE